jgi:hypothetical protein
VVVVVVFVAVVAVVGLFDFLVSCISEVIFFVNIFDASSVQS